MFNAKGIAPGRSLFDLFAHYREEIAMTEMRVRPDRANAAACRLATYHSLQCGIVRTSLVRLVSNPKIGPSTMHSSRIHFATIVLTLASCLAGCAASDAKVEESRPKDVWDYCRRFVDRACQHYVECGCHDSAASQAACLAIGRSVCSTTTDFGLTEMGRIEAMVQEGSLVFDVGAAAAQLDHFEELHRSCDWTLPGVGLYLTPYILSTGVFSGTREVGGSCTSGSGASDIATWIHDCRDGICVPTETGSGICIAPAGLGESCDGSGESMLLGGTARICAERIVTEGRPIQRFDTLECARTEDSAGTCRTRLLGDAGSACSGGTECLSGQCSAEGRCLSGAEADGASCLVNSHCQSKYCEFSDSQGSCQPGGSKKDGAPCQSGADCSSTYCSVGLCRPMMCQSYDSLEFAAPAG